MITPHDARVFAKLRVGHNLNGEADAVSDVFRLVTRRMSKAATEDRDRIWRELLDDLPPEDAEALVKAVAAIDPDAPAPVAEAWDEPDLRRTHPARPFPVEVLPVGLAQLCLEASSSIRCPVDFIAVTALAVAGAAMGQSINLKLKRSWKVAPQLFAPIVGNTGLAKSACVLLAARPLQELDIELGEMFERDLAQWEQSDPKERGSEPVRSRVFVSDITRESLVIVLKENPRGVLDYLDELTAWVASMDQYRNKGSDRQFWLSIWASTPVSVDRKGGREHLQVSHPLVNVVGGLPPSMLPTLLEDRGRDDGFIDRLLFAYPDASAIPSQEWTEEEVSDEAEDDWRRAIRRLWSRPMIVEDRDGASRLRPFYVKFTPDAKRIWTDWWNEHVNEMSQPDFPAGLRGAWSKFRLHAARLALVLGQLHWAYDPQADPYAYPDVDALVVWGAVKLTDYFKAAFRRAQAELEGADCRGSEAFRVVLDWARRSPSGTFSRRDVTRQFPRFRRQEIDDALAELIDRNCVRPRPEPERPEGTRGRKRSPAYDINPVLLAQQNRQYCQNAGSTRSTGLEKPHSGDSGNSAALEEHERDEP